MNIFYGVDWLYGNVESIFAYDYKIIYGYIFYIITNYSIDSIEDIFMYMSLQTSTHQFFWSVIVDNYIYNCLLNFDFTDEWYRSFLSSRDASSLIINHPELIFFKNQLLDNFISNYLTDVNFTVLNFLEEKSLITPVMLLPQLMFLLFYSFIFISFFFSFFSTFLKEESVIDFDYLSASSTVESEKEIGSIDDIIIPILFLLYIFGWYFYLNSYHILFLDNDFSIVIFLFPLLYYVIINVPTFLLIDFGIFYVCFLRGVAPTSIIIFEFVYDVIALIAFYVRLLVQGVRLILMTYAYISMHDYILFYDIFDYSTFNTESIWKDISNTNTSISSVTYFFLLVLPTYIFNWIYEIIHVFFVLTGQLVAYLAMIFWLFLFLFTFFVLYKHEKFFDERRKQKKTFLKNIYKNAI